MEDTTEQPTPEARQRKEMGQSVRPMHLYRSGFCLENQKLTNPAPRNHLRLQ
jgi:hypothetical protein